MANTVKSFVPIQPSFVFVYIRLIVPGEMAVTTPALVIVAMEVLLEAQVPSLVGVTVTISPTQAKSGPPKLGKLGKLAISTSTESREIQLFILVTVKL